jgi:hypothetical protein
MKTWGLMVRRWAHGLFLCLPAYRRRYTLYVLLVAGGRSLEDLRAQDGPINADYCWVHSPGGWICPLCRDEGSHD